jgi:hypothetical protein
VSHGMAEHGCGDTDVAALEIKRHQHLEIEDLMEPYLPVEPAPLAIAVSCDTPDIPSPDTVESSESRLALEFPVISPKKIIHCQFFNISDLSNILPCPAMAAKHAESLLVLPRGALKGEPFESKCRVFLGTNDLM